MSTQFLENSCVGTGQFNRLQRNYINEKKEAEFGHHLGNYEHGTTDAVMSINESSAACFKKGSYIELSNGLIRRVEDIRTEDFIQSALRSPDTQLIESTVVKIDRTQYETVTITFSYDNNRSKVSMEISTAHPFFVYGQGWASCNPLLSHQIYELKCQQIQVGDICLSLTKRETQNVTQYDTLANNDTQNAGLPGYPIANLITSGDSVSYSYQVYAEMANMVAAYAACAQQMFDKMRY